MKIWFKGIEYDLNEKIIESECIINSEYLKKIRKHSKIIFNCKSPKMIYQYIHNGKLDKLLVLSLGNERGIALTNSKSKIVEEKYGTGDLFSDWVNLYDFSDKKTWRKRNDLLKQVLNEIRGE